MKQQDRHTGGVPRQLRFPPELDARLAEAAADHGVAVNWLVVKGLTEFLDHLIPADEMKWTR